MERKKGKIFYGWAVTIGCGLILIYGLGFSVSVFSVFLTPLRETFNLSATQTSSLMSVINIGGLPIARKLEAIDVVLNDMALICDTCNGDPACVKNCPHDALTFE